MSSSAPTPAWVQHSLARLHQLEKVLVIVAFAAIAILLVLDVVLREVITPLLGVLGVAEVTLMFEGSQKVAVFFLIMGAFTGVGVATWMGAQLVPKLGFRAVPPRWDHTMNRVADAVTFVLLAAITWVATRFVLESMGSGQMASGGLHVPVWQIQLAIPVGFGSAGIRYLAFALWPGTRPAAGDTLE